MSTIYNPRTNQFEMDMRPIVRKGITLHRNPHHIERGLVKKKGEDMNLHRNSSLFVSAYKRCVNRAFIEAKKRNAKQIWMRAIINYSYPLPRPTKFASSSEADEVEVLIMFYE